jgi:hypothetical protein
MSEEDDDDINIRISINVENELENDIENIITSRLLQRLYLRYLVDSVIDQMYDEVINDGDMIENDEELQYALRESEQMYKYLERKDVSLNIENKKYKDLSNMIHKECKECVICKDDYEDDDIVTSLKCSHLFHTECIKEWGSIKAECPICRQEISHISKT